MSFDFYSHPHKNFSCALDTKSSINERTNGKKTFKNFKTHTRTQLDFEPKKSIGFTGVEYGMCLSNISPNF